MAAFRLLQRDFSVPNVRMHLEKRIPVGAGLGGGSSDAVACLLGLMELFALPISAEQRIRYSLALGSDCPFFLQKHAVMVHRRGEVHQDIVLPVQGHHLLVVYPGIRASTSSAYAALRTSDVFSGTDIACLLQNTPPTDWKAHLPNDLEAVVFSRYPLLASLKEALYEAGAWYAAMSGSGSALYGLFDAPPPVHRFSHYVLWTQQLS